MLMMSVICWAFPLTLPASFIGLSGESDFDFAV